MRPDGRSTLSKIEQIFLDKIADTPVMEAIEFYDLADDVKNNFISLVMKSCKQYVLGALYEDTEGYLYAFDLSGNGIYIAENAHAFMLRYKAELEKLNYFS